MFGYTLTLAEEFDFRLYKQKDGVKMFYTSRDQNESLPNISLLNKD